MAVIVESMEDGVLTFTMTPDGPSRGPGVPNMASNEIGGPSRRELFTAEWGELVALYRLATSDGRALAEIRLRHEARRQLAERMKRNGIAHSLNFLLTLDPLAAFDALAPKALPTFRWTQERLRAYDDEPV